MIRLFSRRRLAPTCSFLTPAQMPAGDVNSQPISLYRFVSRSISDDIYDPPFSASSKTIKPKQTSVYDPSLAPASKPPKTTQTKKKTTKEDAKLPLHSDLPFDFRYSYSEANPSIKVISYRESPKFSPFGPGRLDRKWTGTSAPAQQEVDRVKVVEERDRVLGEPLSEEEVAELVERYRHSDCARQINLGITHFSTPDEYKCPICVKALDLKM